MTKIILITGANRGLGYVSSRQLADAGHTVLLGSRSAGRGEEAATSLGENATAVQLDVTDQYSIDAAAALIADRFGKIDVLVNNAAIHFDAKATATSADLNVMREAFETNVIAQLAVTHAFLPLLRQSATPNIVNVSSNLSQLAVMGDGSPAYRTTKVALNALTRMLADELRPEGIRVNSIGPGWAATDMGGPEGGPIEPCAAHISAAALDGPDGPTGALILQGVVTPNW